MFNKYFFTILLISVVCLHNSYSQRQINKITSNIILNDSSNTFDIEQKIIFFNPSNKILKKIYLHNWANSFTSNKTPLGKRLIENYKKEFYFSKKSEKGYSRLKKLRVSHSETSYKTLKNKPDIIEISLKLGLKPKDSTTVFLRYTVKPPSSKFTGYGKTKTGYHMRFWQIIPAVYTNKWHLMSNLDMDDLYQDVAKYEIKLSIPSKYVLESNLYQYKTKLKNHTDYYLVGYSKKDIIISIDKHKRFTSFKSKNLEIKTDAFDRNISLKTSAKIIDKQINFIKQWLGKHPHFEIFVDKNTVNKNNLYEIFGLPKWLKPFPENFRWELNFFHALSSKYIDDIIIHNKRTAYWFINGLETFLVMEYLNEYYPNLTILGKYSKYWPIKNYNISKLNQNDKFSFIYQFSARKFFDQALNTPSDSLSNFNRKVISKYKAGLGFKYLQDYLNKAVFKKSIKQYLRSNYLKLSSPWTFINTLEQNTTKNIKWFKNDYLQTSKKIDYKISSIKNNSNSDSLKVIIKNKSNFNAPVALYGIDNKQIIFKKWVVDTTAEKLTVSVAKKKITKLALNYENSYPEYNTLDNFRTLNNKLLNKPIQFRLFKDVEDPYYNQIFYYPDIKYNLYDGVILGIKLENKPVIPRNFEFLLTPNYSTRNGNFTGSFSLSYNYFFQNSSIYKIRFGVSGSNFHYAPNLSYNTFNPYINLVFKRQTLRDVGAKNLMARLIF
ncbi:MAG: aminopeptidase, partial [Tenacibaculum sp.]